MAWTVAALFGLNLLLGYLLARALWGTRVLSVDPLWLTALAVSAGVCVGLAVRSWVAYLRSRGIRPL